MRVLLAGGNDLLRRSVIDALIVETHQVRVATPHAPDSSQEWPAQVEPRIINRNDSAALQRAATDCQAVIVIDQSVTPDIRANKGENNNPAEQIASAAARAGVRRLIRVSARSRERRRSSPESSTATMPGHWLTIRTTPVYGIGDDPLTLFFIMMRSLPAVPVVNENRVLQPVWHEDLARAAAVSLSLPDSELNRDVEIAGPDAVTHEQLYELIAALIDRRPLRIPIPDFLATHGTRLAEALGIPVEALHLAFDAASEGELDDENNALSGLFGILPTSLKNGLARLANELAELPPSEGVGTLEVKRFSADIRDSRYSAPELLRLFRRGFKDVMPIKVGVEPAAPTAELIPGAVVTMALPGRGHVQVRVQEVSEDHVVVATLRGHLLAGIVRFATRALDDAVRFEVMTCDTAANALDWLALTLGGARIQDANWTKVVQNVVKLSGGSTDEVQSDARKLSGEEAETVKGWIKEITQQQETARPAGHSAVAG